MVFGGDAQRWFEAGFNILPLEVKGKSPRVKGWQEWGKNKQSQFQIDSWVSAYGSGNIGLPLGEANGVVALDFDTDADGLWDKIQAIIPPSPCRKVGRKGFTAFYRFNGERSRRWRHDAVGMVCELLSTGTQTVLPYSIHPDTNEPYKWITEDTLDDYGAASLPLLPVDFIEQVDMLFGIDRKIRESFTGDLPEMDTIRQALQHIPSAQYATWIEIGMALQHSYGDGAFTLWDSWSASAVNYDASKMAYKWQSFGKYKGAVISAATILHYAIGYGWIPPRLMNDDAVIEISSPLAIEKEVISAPSIMINMGNTVKQVSPSIPEHLLNAPNIVGELSDWMNSTSIRQQPSLSLGASICAIGAVMGHRFRSPTDLRTNIYAIGVVGAGLGKDHARKCINMLFETVGMGDTMMGDVASDAGLINAIDSRGGVALGMTDEIGDELAALGSKGAGSYEVRIMRLYKELFSSASGVYRGKEYANHDGKMNAKVINQPCLNIYGTTTPRQFYDAMSGAKVLDGFLPRWLIFEGDMEAREIEREGMMLRAPLSLVEKVKAIWDINPAGDSPLMVGEIKPRIVDVTDGAKEKFRQLKAYAEERRIAEANAGSGLDALYARLHEHSVKLALVAHGDGGITGSVAAWACEMMLHLSSRAVDIARTQIGDNEYERNMQAVAAFIRGFEGDGVGHTAVLRKFQKFELKALHNILHHLHECGTIDARQTLSGNQKPVTRYFAD